MLRQLVLTLVLCSLAVAQENASRGNSSSIDSSNNNHPLLVDALRKSDGAQVNELTAGNFQVRVDGRSVNVLSAERIALINPTVVVLLDISGSMAQLTKWNTAISLAESTIHALADPNVLLVTFADRQHPSETYAGTDEALRQLELMKPRAEAMAKGRTELWDTIAAVLNNSHLHQGAAVISITDAGDNDSRQDFGKLKRQLELTGVRVFSIRLAQDPIGTAEEDARRQMLELCDSTGGALLPIGIDVDWFRYSPSTRNPKSNFEVSAKEQNAIPAFGSYIAGRILKPYLLTLELPAQATGKLKVESIDGSGKIDKKLKIVAADQLAVSVR